MVLKVTSREINHEVVPGRPDHCNPYYCIKRRLQSSKATQWLQVIERNLGKAKQLQGGSKGIDKPCARTHTNYQRSGCDQFGEGSGL